MIGDGRVLTQPPCSLFRGAGAHGSAVAGLPLGSNHDAKWIIAYDPKRVKAF
jgi:hypothetical protein